MKFVNLLIIILVIATSAKAEVDSLTIIKKEFYQATEDTSAYVKISYPQISGLGNSEVQGKINSFLETEFMQAKSWFDDFVADTDYTSEFPPDWVFSFETDFRVTFNSKDFISVVLDYYEFTGGAHGNYYSIGYNIRTSDGKVFGISDILKPNSLQALSEFCAEEIMNMFDANSLNEAGLFEDELNISEDQDFYIIPNALVIQFDPYEVAPYAMGSIDVELEFSKIKNIIKDNLPFYKK
ncbi:DUF3298 and DUF4163 domain-containing protein [Ignavibacterium sp.]|uniref:DUF3298 and DUF4163 domain-containing protein n=1 Tax=Ignavibacterium sp. TaxID=2651167 RepID=UPI0022075FA7|nr:DUF3298 and DUF4163 domain-containing protein [Ignavibacterium sp.]BDQ04412.1 MAG: hypothetical protein KatS3mg037_2987 [Ignavibacterium sp.]